MTSLHTKYRPTTFDEVLGQDDTIRSLKKVVKDGRAHVFAFVGPAGTGKTTLARILANLFAGTAGTIANIQEVAAADHTGVEAMREIASRANFRAIGESPTKTIILDETQRLSGAAWDVLLKPTEEPPSHVYWMFCTTVGGKIPKTIQTRCLTYNLKPVAEDKILKLLVKVAEGERLDTHDEVLEAIAEAAQGSPRQALVFLEACVYAESANEARQIMRQGGQGIETVNLCRWLVAGRSFTWGEAVKFVKALEGTDAESVRIQVVNYLSSVLLNTKDGKRAAALLGILECFDKPYNQTDRMAPLLLSLGLALGLDR